MRHALLHVVAASCLTVSAFTSRAAAADVSYYGEIRPIFQAHCQGCHQPAKDGGGYVMTDFERLLAGGESETAAVLPGMPDESYLIELITPVDGTAQMPQGKQPLSSTEIDAIRRWIQQGAEDDTPDNAKERFDPDHPPVYSRAPVITSIDYSPDGTLLAVAGFHEVLLLHADGSGTVGRLIGLSARIESIAFSPDGNQLAVTGGLPERTGELQIWNVADHSLVLSKPLTYDTVYGASWSPDGTLVAVGCPDKTVRGFDATTGEQVFFNAAHDDWALDTEFSVDGSHIISVGRDMTTRLYNLETQRFIDNVTSITPGALKGGLAAVARHPQRDEVLVGGSDGVPRIYRMHRETKRVIGDDANLIRRFPPMVGRVHTVDFSSDGKSIVCGSSLDGCGQVVCYSVDYDGTLSESLKKILAKLPGAWTPEERAAVEEYVTDGVQVQSEIELSSPVFAVRFAPDGKTVAAAGMDGLIRLIDPADGSVTKKWTPVDIDPNASRSQSIVASTQAEPPDVLSENETLPAGRSVTALEVTPPEIRLYGAFDKKQLVVSGILDNGDRIDVTRMAEYTFPESAGRVTGKGEVQVAEDGLSAIVVRHGEHTLGIPVVAEATQSDRPISYVRDVMPVISRLGCNAGTCHGAKDGKDGFKLSLRGYDKLFDIRAWTDDLKARRINLASPDDSLMLLKATGAVPHVGGQLTKPGLDHYRILRQWIAEGARLDEDAPTVEGLRIEPQNPVVQQVGARQQMRVVATYSDGSTRDVTADAFVESGNTDVAAVNEDKIVTTLRRGEAPILARFEGAYAATTVTAMGDRDGFEWEPPETWNKIDELVAVRWQRMKIRPSGLCTDAEFLRRVYLDLTGLPPSADDVRVFLADEQPTRQKRAEVIDRLVGSEAYVTYWSNKWADLLQVNQKFLGQEGAAGFRAWIRQQLEENVPYDQFCRSILRADGSNKENPAASYYKILREPDAIMENSMQLFLGVRFNCNKCHDHPFERWTQDQYYETAAYFARVALKKDEEASGTKTIGGTAVEGAKPLYEVVFEKDEGEIIHERTGAVTAPSFPYEVQFDAAAEATRRQQLAEWMTSPDNDYFVQSYVNRVWGYLLGVGLIEPLDDIRAGNPPTNPELLEYLSAHFVESGFDVRSLTRLICSSRTYQLSLATNEWNADDERNYSHATARRLPAEVLYDSVYAVTGSQMKIPGVPEGTRAAALAEAGMKLPDGFLANLGRPPRESACECERSGDLQLGPVMALMNGQTVSQAISDSENAIAKLVAENPDDAAVINEIYLRILNRPADPVEVDLTLEIGANMAERHQQLKRELDAYRAQAQADLERRERQREQAIAAAKADLEAYEEELAPMLAERKRQQQSEVDELTKQLAEFDAANLQQALAEFEKGYQRSITWVTLDPTTMTSNTETKLSKLPDLSILGSRPGTTFCFYVVKAETTLSRITALKLEALTHETLPNFGPGFAENANFVLNEIRLSVAPASNPAAVVPLPFGEVMATFTPGGDYSAEDLIDGNRAETDEGWTISPEVGKDHSVILTLKNPVPLAEKSELTVLLEQIFVARDHTLGRFRLSVTDDPEPQQYGVPRDIDAILSIASGERTVEQQEQLLTWFKGQYEERRAHELALNKSKLPLPEDEGLVTRKARLADAERPIPVDPHLVRLERAARLSEEQLGSIRLTMAQDLAWALINSPAFLFNR